MKRNKAQAEGKHTPEPYPFLLRLAALERVAEAAEKLLKRNIGNILDSSKRSLYPHFIGVVTDDYSALRAALSALDSQGEGS